MNTYRCSHKQIREHTCYKASMAWLYPHASAFTSSDISTISLPSALTSASVNIHTSESSPNEPVKYAEGAHILITISDAFSFCASSDSSVGCFYHSPPDPASDPSSKRHFNAIKWLRSSRCCYCFNCFSWISAFKCSHFDCHFSFLWCLHTN